MTFTNITRLSSLLFLSSFIALMISTGGTEVHAQSTHTITINNNCSETIWVGANPTVQSVTIGGQPVTTLGGWEMTQGQSATVLVPLNWNSGRFWARTGCSFNTSNVCDDQTVKVNGNDYIIANCCDTGGCVNGSGVFALDCVQTGLPPATLAELTVVSSGQDSYDVSMVDGGNVSAEIIPDSSTYDCTGNSNCIFTGNLPGKSTSTCSQDSDCYPLFGFGFKWKCDPTLNKCVNPFFCGSPGCTDTGGCAPVGLTQSVLANSTWASGGLAVSQSSCSSELQATNDQNQGSTYVGCFAPQKFCRKSCSADGDCGPPYTFNCGTSSGFCEDSGGTVLGADCDTNVPASGSDSATTKGDLWACTGVNSGSCFTTGVMDPNCCGCPSWAPGFPNGACVAGNNSLWGTNAEPAVTPFNTASPTSYAFPFDDAIKLFMCEAKSGSVTNYTVNFCPDDSDGDGVQSSQDVDADGDGITNDNETLSGVTASTREAGPLNDPDMDGVPNMFDLDSDNDGLTDIVEARAGNLDQNGDGRVDDTTDTDGDGLADAADPDQGGLELRSPDTDGDGMDDFVDTDSDNEAGTDFEENGGFEADGDGLPDATMDENSDGLLDIFDPQRGGMPLEEKDADNDGVPNQLDVSGGGSGNCSLAPSGAGTAGFIPLYLLIPALILVRRITRQNR